jgi:iron complex outermembrane receptor protein
MVLAVLTTVHGYAQDTTAKRLGALSLEDLLDVQVTSVSRKEQSLSRVGAAVYVITEEEIRRSGMTNIPDLLRMAPGVNVARVTANTWAITVRGFNERYSTKVLVLIDGRSVYTQAFSGVYWDQQSVPVEEIARIEVIRGPGGTVWGANAVNGVINIITKHSDDTQGGLLATGTGSQEFGNGFLRYGGKAGTKGSYRVYGRHFQVDNSTYGPGRSANDAWHGTQVGFRSDWNLSPKDTLLLEGDFYSAREAQNLTTVLSLDRFQAARFDDHMEAETTNVLGRWSHTFSDGSQSSLQFFYSDFVRLDQGMDDQDTIDVDFQHRFLLGNRHEFVSGVAYRHTALSYQGLHGYSYHSAHHTDEDAGRDSIAARHPTGTPTDLSSNLFSTFLQDEIRLNNTVFLTAGSKLEHNSFSGFEYEPSVQVVWAPDARKTIWASAARAIQQPSWFYSNSILDAASFPLDDGGVGVFRLLGNPDVKPEKSYDFEGGSRFQVGKRLSFDLAAFLSHHRDLATAEPEEPFFSLDPAPHLVVPAIWRNLADGRTFGIEGWATFQATSRWRITPGFSLLHMKIRRDADSHDTLVEDSVGNSPTQQFQLRSTLNLTSRLEWDAALYYTGSLLTTVGPSLQPLDSYARVDTRLGWRIGEFTELSIAGQNLLSPRRFEFTDVHQVHATQAQRSVLGKIAWRF